MVFNDAACILCGGKACTYLFAVQGHPLIECQSCKLQFLNPQPSDERLQEIYSANYAVPLADEQIDQLKSQTARLYLELLESFRLDRKGNRLLEIGCGKGNLLQQAKGRGYDVKGVDFSPASVCQSNEKLGENLVICGDIGDVDPSAEKFDVIVASEVVEHVRNPIHFLKRVADLLEADGLFFCTLPSLSGWSAKLMGRLWMEYKEEHLFYFTTENFVEQLKSIGFRQIRVEPNKRMLSPAYIIAHFQRYEIPLATKLLAIARSLMPVTLLNHPLSIETGGITVLARL